MASTSIAARKKVLDQPRSSRCIKSEGSPILIRGRISYVIMKTTELLDGLERGKTRNFTHNARPISPPDNHQHGL
jgi:hypothetical protein